MISVVIAVILVSIIIYLLKNKKEVEKIYNKLKDKKIIKILKVIVIIIIFILFFRYSLKISKEIINDIKLYKEQPSSKEFFEEFDDKLKEELKVYNELIENEYGEAVKTPYIPEGFEYLEGNIYSGYVIQDINGNQYVWVPCTNKDDENIVKFQRKDFYVETGIRYFDCFNTNSQNFIKSALENGGFYISRFEIGKEGENLVSKSNIPVLSYVSRNEISELAQKMYSNINCELVNGYAYDTTLEWIKKTNKVEFGKYYFNKGEEILTGRAKYNNIYDFIDNVMEITTEDFYDSIIYRGFDYGEDIELDSRYNLSEDRVSSYNEHLRLLAFRTILYK